MLRGVHSVKEWYGKNKKVIHRSKSNIMTSTTMQHDILTNVSGIDICLSELSFNVVLSLI